MTVVCTNDGTFLQGGSFFSVRGVKIAANDRARWGNFDHTGLINFGPVFTTSFSDVSLFYPY